MKIPEEITINGNVIDVANKKYLVSEMKFKNFLHQGLYLGTNQQISIPLSYELSNINFPKVIISNQAAEKFTHGENIYRKAVIKGNVTGEVVVMNKLGDCIGFGKWENKILTNIRDVGEYLRSEKNNKTV